MSGNFILEFPSMKSTILAVTHARAGKVVCSLCCCRWPDNNRLITALWAVEMFDAKIRKQYRTVNVRMPD